MHIQTIAATFAAITAITAAAHAQPADTDSPRVPLPRDLEDAVIEITPAKTRGLYLSASVAAIGFADAEILRDNQPTADLEFKGGYGFNAAIGYDFPGLLYGKDRGTDEFTINLRLEVEGFHAAADGDDFDANGGPTQNPIDLETYGGGVNAYADFDLGGPLSIYTGFGIGGALIDADSNGISDSAAAAYAQFLLGLEYEIDNHWAVYTGLRSRGYSEVELDNADLEELGSGSVELGLRYTF